MESITWALYLDLDSTSKSLLHFDGVGGTNNLITNPSFETNTAGWTGLRATETLAVSTDAGYIAYGASAMKVTLPGSTTEGVYCIVTGLTPGQTYTFSVYVRGNVTLKLVIDEYTSGWSTIGSSSSAVVNSATSSPQRIEVTRTLDATGSICVLSFITDVTQAGIVYIDGCQFEANPYATPFCVGSRVGATVFLDDKSRYWAPHGNVQISNAQSKFGGGSGLFDGTGDYLSTAKSEDFDFGTGDWTVDFWVYRNGDLDNTNGFFSAAESGQTGWNICSGTGATANKVRIASKASGSWVADIESSTTLADLTWTHVAVVRNGNTLTMYFNGTSVGTADVTGYTYNSAGTGAAIGRRFTDEDDHYFKGWIDELRVSKGVARWTGNFTSPTAAYDLWTDATADVLLGDAPISWSGGTQSTAVTQLLADPGQITFALDNGLSNSAGKYGYYSPGHADCRSGFARGARVKLKVVYGASTKYQGMWWILNDPMPTAGLYRQAITVVKAVDWLGVAQEMSMPTLSAQANKCLDELLPVLLAACPTQPPGTPSYSANGDTIFASAFDKDDTMNDSVYSVLAKLCRSEFGRIHLKPTATDLYLLCENRNYRAGVTSPLAALSDDMDGLEIIPDMNYYDQVKVTINPRRLSSGNVTLATYNPRLQLAPDETKEFEMFYVDPTSGDRISGTNIVDPLVAGTHYKFGSVNDGVSQDLNADLTATLVTVGANSSTVSLHNTGANSGYVNLLILQGLAIYSSDPYTATAGSGLRTLTFDQPYQSNPLMADAICNYLYAIVTTAGYRGMRVDFHANKSATLMGAALTAYMTTLFTVGESLTGTSGNWWVNGYQMTIGPGGRLDVSWWMVPYNSQTVADIAPVIEIVLISTASATGGGFTSLTWSHNNTGSKLFVKISIRGPTDPGTATATYGGEAMTLVAEKLSALDGTGYGYVYAAIFYLAAPGAGAHDVVVSWSGTHYGGGMAISVNHCSGYSGAVSATGTDTTPTVNVSSTGSDYVLDAMASGVATSEDAVVGAGQTIEEEQRYDDGAGRYMVSAASIEAGTTTVTMSWTLPNSYTWAICGVSMTGGA
jgi:hypothetical protein